MLLRFHALRDPGVAFLAHHLVSSAGDAAPQSGAVELQLTALCAAVGLCARVPQRAAALVGLLTTWPSGAGQNRFPELAAWLGEDALLDRYLHLCGLAGEPAEPSRTLLRDFAQAARLLRERDYLTGQDARDDKQQKRLIAHDGQQSNSMGNATPWPSKKIRSRCCGWESHLPPVYL